MDYSVNAIHSLITLTKKNTKKTLEKVEKRKFNFNESCISELHKLNISFG